MVFPNNPAYSLIKNVSTSDPEKRAEQERKESKKFRTFLDFCREQSIAFTDTDKVMFNLKTSKDLHFLMKNFMDTKANVMDHQAGSRYSKPSNLNFNKQGGLSRLLNEEEMIQAFKKVIDDKLKVPMSRKMKKKLMNEVTVTEADLDRELLGNQGD